MKINQPDAALEPAEEKAQKPPRKSPGVRVTTSSSRLAANAAGAAVAGSAVGLAFFLSRKPTPSLGRHHAKFRA